MELLKITQVSAWIASRNGGKPINQDYSDYIGLTERIRVMESIKSKEKPVSVLMPKDLLFLFEPLLFDN